MPLPASILMVLTDAVTRLGKLIRDTGTKLE